MSEPFRFDAAASAAEIVRTLHPHRVWCAGPDADELAAALGALGVEAGPGGAVDLAVSTGTLDARTAACMASRSTAILFEGADLPLETLRLLSNLGFLPQPDLDTGWQGGLLFRRADAASSELAAIADVIESQRAAIDHLGANAALAQRGVEDILHSRIWRTLRACAAPLVGAATLVRRMSPRPAPRETASALEAYARWIYRFERRDDALMQLRSRAFAQRPLVSVLVPVYRPAPADLKRAISSVLAQGYSNWELCLADDGSGAPVGADDARIRVTAVERAAGISAASNAALALARGEYVALLDQTDELSPDALFYAVDAINRHPRAAFLYSDEDKTDIAGNRYDPFFKPDWSPDLLLSENYCGDLLVARRELVEQAGGFRPEYDGAEDYDLILRLTELTPEVAHIARVLYHRRAAVGSAAEAEAGRRAVEDHLRRLGKGATVVPGCGPGRQRVRYPIAPGSRAGILIPSGGNEGALRACLETLESKTTYPDYEVLVIDNSRGRRIERLVRSWKHGHAVGYLDWRGQPFNYSTLNNAAARECSAPLLVFLNDDVEVIEPGWLDAMIELGGRPETGAVGAKLLYPDGRIQHAGVALGILESAGHPFRGFDGDAHHYFDFPDVIRNVSAVTGACMLVRASAFEQVGGFDEGLFPVSFNDIDLCLRLGRRGLRNVYTPHALLMHHESLSRGPRKLIVDTAGCAAMRARWHDLLDADPYYSPNLTRSAEDYSVRQGV